MFSALPGRSTLSTSCNWWSNSRQAVFDILGTTRRAAAVGEIFGILRVGAAVPCRPMLSSRSDLCRHANGLRVPVRCKWRSHELG